MKEENNEIKQFIKKLSEEEFSRLTLKEKELFIIEEKKIEKTKILNFYFEENQLIRSLFLKKKLLITKKEKEIIPLIKEELDIREGWLFLTPNLRINSLEKKLKGNVILTLDEEEELLKRGKIQKFFEKQYFLFQKIQKKMDLSLVSIRKEKFSDFLMKLRSLLIFNQYRELELPNITKYKDNFSFLDLKKQEVVSEDDNYYLEETKNNKLETRLLKPHCTGVMLSKIFEIDASLPVSKYFSISRVFRKETEDKTHSSEFTQLEITIIFDSNKEEIVMKKLIEESIKVLSYCQVKFEVKYYPTYYPYTTPSFEFYDKEEVELGGGGLFNFHPFSGLRNKKVIGFAIGLERIYMRKEGVKKISEVYE